MIKKSMLAALAASCALAFVALPAAADHKWRKNRVIYPDFEIYTSSVERLLDEDVWLDQDDEDVTVHDMRERRKRWARENDEAWWMDDDLDADDEEDLPASIAKPAKKKAEDVKPKTSTKTAAKPAKAKTPVVTKVEPKAVTKKTQTASIAQVKDTKSAPAVVTPAPKPVAKLAAVTPKQTVPAKPTTKPTGKTIGCTGGAAVVTGLGFASVRPRVCTGDTYAYMATKPDGNYAIKLKANSGEVVDVTKLP